MNVAIYPRKSKANDNSQSMEQQIADCRRYIDAHYPNSNVIVFDGDYALTGHSTKKRKDFQRMMESVRSGKIQMVVIMRYDRIARNMRDFCNLYHDMEEAGCNLVSVSQQIDTSTPYGKNFMYQMAAMAELEWAIISERYKDTARYKREHGFAYTGRVPYGYKIQMCDDGHKRVVKDEKHDAMVVFNYYRECRSKEQTIRYMNSIGDKEFSYDIIRKMFSSDMYCGKVKGNENFCEPYMTQEEMDELRGLKVIKCTPSGTTYIFSGLLVCPICGKHMYGVRGGKNLLLRYYRCGVQGHKRDHRIFMVNEDKIEEKIVDMLDVFLNQKIATFEHNGKKSNAESIEKLKEDQERLNYLFEKGRIKIDDYEKKYDDIERKIDSMKAEDKQIDFESVKKTFSVGWKEMYLSLTPERKKIFLHSTIKEIRISENKGIQDIIFVP